MPARPALLALDFGAESSRVCAVTRTDRGLDMRVLHRFPTRTAQRTGDGALCWDLPYLLAETEAGLARAASDPLIEPVSLGVDTWGVDFALCPPDGPPIPERFPVCYRDSRTRGKMEALFARVPRERVYELTGVQFLPFNTLFQLAAELDNDPPAATQRLVLRFMPDLLHHHLAAAQVSEFSIATTSQLFDPRRREWSGELLGALGVTQPLMQPLVAAGTVIGSLGRSVQTRCGLPALPLVAVATHDTASAFAAAPLHSPDAAIISSGTWSLIGVEQAAPLITEAGRACNVTNEGSASGGFRVLKNVAGMWPLQQCRRHWWPDGAPSYAELLALADSAPPFSFLIDPDDPALLAPADMPAALAHLAIHNGYSPPATRGVIVRGILESLALKYRFVLEQLDALLPGPAPCIHVIGGGSQNDRLNQWTADATGRVVMAGPVEASALGNALVQALALGWVDDLESARRLVTDSTRIRVFEPGKPGPWDEAYHRFQRLLARPTEG